jgi:hypothetical protein
LSCFDVGDLHLLAPVVNHIQMITSLEHDIKQLLSMPRNSATCRQ